MGKLFLILISIFLCPLSLLLGKEHTEFGVEQIVDSLERLKIPHCVYPGEKVRPLHPDMQVCGVISTVELSCLSDDRERVCQNNRAYLDEIPEGTVIVIHQQGKEGACFGSVLSNYAQQRGIIGVIIFGNARDIKDLRKSTFPFFCQGKHCLRSTPRLKVTGIQQPIEIDGKGISPGDFVFADESGTVFFESKYKEMIFEEAKEKLHKEEFVLDLIKSGKKWPEIDSILEKK